jgi:ADP-ribose pyrophosphatase
MEQGIGSREWGAGSREYRMMSEVEKVVDSRSIYEGKKVNLRVDTVLLRNGETAQREIVSVPPAVVILPLTEDGQVHLVRQYRPAAGRTLLELPAGTLAAGEAPLDCAKRELAEEIGRQADDWQPITSFYTTPGIADEMLHLFVARGLTEAESHPDVDEFIELVTVPLEDARGMVHSGELNDAKSIIGLLLAPDR